MLFTARLRAERGYNFSDIVTTTPPGDEPAALAAFAENAARFYREHMHTDEEIRYCLDGAGYFDVRDAHDRWVRVEVRKGDLIVLPAGMYHRFTVTESSYARVLRLFVNEAVWQALPRPQEDHAVRRAYLDAHPIAVGST
jgi:1,2-dihydroxy-3-keto-5-methylthiopentene dioxygenase